ncbi:muconolactone delta-isomerase (plasmid) [Alteromonas mediterranea 615]|uniref:Muconolactone delta-isomerase n=1 Tax=Alteromonas mediterranea 615 TaxID=1300253 RepID=S5AI80_9ALTE|nr:muconolactone delta-isomerase [Alteromonas mediterranea 615]
MLFKVEMTVIPPAHLSEEEFNAIKLKEKNYAEGLQEEDLGHLWRVAGQYANVSILR